MRHFQYLSDSALACLALLLQVVEVSAMLPRQLRAVIAALIPKKVLGFRPIVFFSPFRFWGKAGRPWALSWGADHDRPYWATGKHRAATDIAWRQCARAESSTVVNDHAASIF